MSLGYRWLNYVQESVIAPDIIELDRSVTGSLLRLTKKLEEEGGAAGQSATCTSQLKASRASDFRGLFIALRS